MTATANTITNRPTVAFALLSRFWPHLLIVIAASIAGWKAASLWHAGEIERLTAKLELAKAEAVAEARVECEMNQAITRKVSHDLQEKLRVADARHADAIHRLLAHEAAKRVPPSGTAPGHDAGAAGAGLLGADPAVAVSLIDLGNSAERQTAQLEACQQFIRETWEGRSTDGN